MGGEEKELKRERFRERQIESERERLRDNERDIYGVETRVSYWEKERLREHAERKRNRKERDRVRESLYSLKRGIFLLFWDSYLFTSFI